MFELSAYSKNHVNDPFPNREGSPRPPRNTRAVGIRIDFPAAELLVEPPSILAVTHLQIREPFCHHCNERSINANGNPCKEPASSRGPFRR